MTDLKNQEWLKTLPNKLTIGRMLCVPILLVLYPLNFDVLRGFCAFLFLVAALTDLFDGWIARKYNAESELGALLDPIADKMLIGCALLLLAYADKAAIVTLIAGLLLARDIGVSGLRMVALERSLKIEVNDFGKWKTGVQDAAIFCLLIPDHPEGVPFRVIGMLCLFTALGLSAYSAWLYFVDFREKAKNRENPPVPTEA